MSPEGDSAIITTRPRRCLPQGTLRILCFYPTTAECLSGHICGDNLCNFVRPCRCLPQGTLIITTRPRRCLPKGTLRIPLILQHCVL